MFMIILSDSNVELMGCWVESVGNSCGLCPRLPQWGGWLGDLQCGALGLLLLKWRIFLFHVTEFAELLIVFFGEYDAVVEGTKGNRYSWQDALRHS